MRNRIVDNIVGIESRLVDPNHYLGASDATSGNVIERNATGIDLIGSVSNQVFLGNGIGVSGVGQVGGSDDSRGNQFRENDVAVSVRGDVSFNSFTSNAIAVLASDGQLISGNVFDRNSDAGVLTSGVGRIVVASNTFYNEQGDSVRLQSGAAEIELVSNVFWTDGATNIHVANDSQSGYFSDFNVLHATNGGVLVHWVVDFFDILDWQASVARFDLGSIGSTAVDPVGAQPRFAARGRGDFDLLDPVSGQR